MLGRVVGLLLYCYYTLLKWVSSLSESDVVEPPCATTSRR